MLTGYSDSGDNAALADYPGVTDLEGNARIVHKVVDLGCFEHSGGGLMFFVR